MAKSKKEPIKKPVEVSLETLLAAGAHFGHQSSRWHPKMKQYLYGVQQGIHVFDLAKTKEGLEEAKKFVSQTMAEGGNIIFVGTKRQAGAIIEEEAKRAGLPYVNERWLGGTITNWEEMHKRIKKMEQMKEDRGKGEFKKYTKKEQLLLDREISRLEKLLGGLEGLAKLPEAVFIVDAKKEEIVVKEARMRGIKVVAIVDSNTDPKNIDYIIPANDDAVGAIKFLVSEIAGSAMEGKAIWEKKQKK